MQKGTTAYLLARVPMAISFLGHGLVRIPKLNQFSDGMVAGFEDTLLPTVIVQLFSMLLPFVELLLGLALLVGFRMKITSIVGVVLISILIFGSSFQENWSAIATQLFYAVYLTGLFFFADYNKPIFKN